MHVQYMQYVSIQEFPDLLISRGRYSASIDEIHELTGRSDAAIASGLQRLRRQHRVFSPTRGLYVVIPPEFRSWGVVPADWFINDLMRHLGRRYYVALLSAAAYHGAAHQAPQVFQVMADGRVLDRAIERVRLRFYVSEHTADTPTDMVTVHTGSIPVSSREATVVDLVREPRASGGISNVATILAQIGELDGSALATLAARYGRTLARRTGWVVEHFGSCEDFGPLRLAARLDLGEPALLSPSGPRRGRADPTWGVRMNVAVEPDL
jgi:predicted transcriptional regulator of viral defense system